MRELSERQLGEMVGDRIACAWRVDRGIIWVQLRDPKLVKRMQKVAGARLVMRGLMGGYLRTFELKKSLEWAKKWLSRARSANEGGCASNLDQEKPKRKPRVKTPEGICKGL